MGWAEKDDYFGHSEYLETFGGYMYDSRHGYDETQSINDGCEYCGRYRLSCKYWFEMRYGNIFDLKIGDCRNMQLDCCGESYYG